MTLTDVSRVAVALVALLAAACAQPTAPPRAVTPYVAASAWEQAAGSPGRGSPATAVGPRSGHVAWRRSLEGAVVAGAAIGVDGSILQASNAGVLHALDPHTGRDRWTFDGGSSYGSDLSTTPAVLRDGTVLWPGPGNALIALTQSGRELWREQFSAFVLSPALVGGDRVYVGDMAGHVTALDVRPSGRSRAWTVDLGGTSYSSPAVGPDGSVYAASDRTVVSLVDHRRSATVRWRYSARDKVEVSLAVGPDGTVILGTNGDDEIGLRPNGRVRWRFNKGDWSYSSPVVRGDAAYFGDHLGYLDVVDIRTGRARHRDLGIAKAAGTTSAGTGVWTAPVVDQDGNVFFGTAAGHVYGFGSDGQRLWDLDAGAVVASYPALTSDGLLVVGASDGSLYALRD